MCWGIGMPHGSFERGRSREVKMTRDDGRSGALRELPREELFRIIKYRRCSRFSRFRLETISPFAVITPA